MCGIVGIWDLKKRPIDQTQLDQFTDSLAHRGPDGRGTYIDDESCVGLGHRRLAILDLSPAGRQPLSYRSGLFWITFNGEIYNYIELKTELQSLGHFFKTGTDTEVILAAYAQWGPSCQERFNGMWAFALWDRQNRTLFLSRDRFGVKPLYYMQTDSVFCFASEIKAFLAISKSGLDIDETLVSQTLADLNGLESEETTLAKGIAKILPGHNLMRTSSGKQTVSRWWNTLDAQGEVPDSDHQKVDDFRSLFLDACRLRMRSDVPIATSLSGGLDSSAVACAVSTLGPRLPQRREHWQKAFVACFPGTPQDEYEYAQEVIKEKTLEPIYTEIRVTESEDLIRKVVFQFEDITSVPFLGPYLNYEAMRRRGVFVSLDGHGADELLGGYAFFVERAMDRSVWPWPRWTQMRRYQLILQGMGTSADSLSRRVTRTIKGQVKSTVPGRCFSDVWKALRRITGHDWFRSVPPPFPRRHILSPPFGGLNADLFHEFHFGSLPVILRNFDRASMAHGVEVRMPFLDWRLVAFLFSLPEEWKIGENQTKRILREAMRGIVPERIRTRTTKIGFTSPLAQWMKGPLHTFCFDTLSDTTFLSSPIWNGKAIARWTHERARAERWDDLPAIWPFLNAHLLHQQFKGRGGAVP